MPRVAAERARLWHRVSLYRSGPDICFTVTAHYVDRLGRDGEEVLVDVQVLSPPGSLVAGLVVALRAALASLEGAG